MQAVIRQVPDRFPEPAFSALQRAVFSDIQHESAALAHVASLERASAQGGAGTTGGPPIVRYGAYVDERLVGWSFGWFERGRGFTMANSGVAASHRRQGIYAGLLDAVLSHARSGGAFEVRSQHSVLNNTVIVCKLRRGFHIAGLSASAQMGTLVELVRHLSEPRGELFRSRVVPWVEPQA